MVRAACPVGGIGPASVEDRFQKYLFLLSQEQPSYHFLPHRHGCFSFNAEAADEVSRRTGRACPVPCLWIGQRPRHVGIGFR